MKTCFSTMLVTGAAVFSSFLLPIAAAAQTADCPNFWENPTTGEIECFGAGGSPALPTTPPPANAPTPNAPSRRPTSASDVLSASERIEFTQRFVSGCMSSGSSPAGMSQQQKMKFCQCAARESLELPPQRLLALMRQSAPQRLKEPEIRSIGMTCLAQVR